MHGEVQQPGIAARWSRRYRESGLRDRRLRCPHPMQPYPSAAVPASLSAFVAWQSGNGALAKVALDGALRDDPYYSMAHLLRQVIDSGPPPSMARLPMTPRRSLPAMTISKATGGNAPVVMPCIMR